MEIEAIYTEEFENDVKKKLKNFQNPLKIIKMLKQNQQNNVTH